MADLSIIIVNYNNFDVLKRCLPSLMPALEKIDTEILLSDNGSTDGSLDWVRQAFPDIRILANERNLGFAEANNRALAHVHGRYILLLNPDTILNRDSIRPMFTFLEHHPQTGAVGCTLTNPDGTRQISARSFPTLLTYFLHFSGLAWRYPHSRFFGRFNMTYWDGTTARPVDWVCGASLMFRSEIIKRIGGLDPYFFLTYDEVDFCRRIKDAGYEIWYTPDAHIVHLEGQSEPQSNLRPEARLKYLTVERNSRVRYFVKQHGILYATLVELLHLLMNATLWIKAKLLGTNQPPIRTMEKGLLLRLYWRTALRIPRACWKTLTRTNCNTPKRQGSTVFVNPYLADM